MSDKLDPRLSEFETEEQAQSHDRWFKAKVEAALKDERLRAPHDQVMAEIEAVIRAAERRRA